MCLHLIDNISFHLKVKYKFEVLTFSTDCYNKPEKKPKLIPICLYKNK